MSRERKLGRGLDFLLSESARQETGEELLLVSVDEIRPNRFQPRKNFKEEELKNLADSIRNNGVLQPLVVRKSDNGFELIAGERRLRASQSAGLSKVPVIVRDVSDDKLIILAMIENLQREDLNAIEKAKACCQFIELTGATQEETAQKLNMSRSSLANLVRLLELPLEIQEFVSRGTLAMGHARALLSLKDKEEQIRLAKECIQNDWSVREIERQVSSPRVVEEKVETEGKARKLPPWHRELEERLSHVLDNRVVVKFSGKKAKIIIQTGDKESFNNLFDRLTAIPDQNGVTKSDDVGEYFL